MRTAATGATRDKAEGKPDYEGYLSPLVIRRYGQYMLEHQTQADGKLRSSDNWQKGMPTKWYMSSLLRHIIDVWTIYRGYKVVDSAGNHVDYEGALCAVLFNVSGMLLNSLRGNDHDPKE